MLVDGRAIKSCTVLAVALDGSSVTTIEGLAATAEGDGLHPMQIAFHEQHGLQCGFCTPGMILSAVEMVTRNPTPTEAEVRAGLEGNLCRCTGYQNIVASVMAGAEAMRAAGGLSMVNPTVSAPTLRKEDRRFITGRGNYVADLKRPGMTAGVFVRSPHAHAP